MWLSLLCWPVLGQAQTKIMEYKTDIAWSDSGCYFGDGTMAGTAVPIGTDFLAIAVNRTGDSMPGNQILYILDLKKKTLARKFDANGRGYYWVSPSATTSSFIVQYNDGQKNCVQLFTFNKRTKSWTEAISDVVDTGFATAPSSPVLPAYFVNTVKGGDKLELHVFRY